MSKSERVRSQLKDFTDTFVNSKGEAEDIMIDVMAKRISPTKRQIMYMFYILLRYIRIKENPRS
jgi:glucan phosphorylase